MIGPETELAASLASMIFDKNKTEEVIVDGDGIESPPLAFSRLNSVASMKSIDSRMSFQGIPLPDVCAKTKSCKYWHQFGLRKILSYCATEMST